MDEIELLERHREIMRRLAGVSLTEVTINQSVVADAIEKFLQALNRPAVPIRWARDSREAATLVASAEQITPIDDVKVNPGTFREWFIRKETNWRNARDEALTAAQNDVLQFVQEMLIASGDPSHSQVWRAYGNALIFAARAAAECLWAREYYETEKRFRQYDINEFEPDWFPFVDAYEAGLWLFWLTGSKVIALSRPIVQLKGQQVHSEVGAAVRWPEGEEEYFVLNGVPVSREIVETPANELDPQLLLTERNANVRREIVRKIGLERICRGLNAKRLDSEGGYELLLLDLEDGRARPFLKMKDLSTGICHVEGVAPECTTVASALEWRNQTDVPPTTFPEQRVESTYHWYQQGDVTIKPVPKIPRRAVATGNRVLAEGETTGHAHVAEAEDVSLFLHEETLFMRAPTGTALAHQNHQALKVPPGDYVVARVRKYDHFAEEDDDKF